MDDLLAFRASSKTTFQNQTREAEVHAVLDLIHLFETGTDSEVVAVCESLVKRQQFIRSWRVHRAYRTWQDALTDKKRMLRLKSSDSETKRWVKKAKKVMRVENRRYKPWTRRWIRRRLLAWIDLWFGQGRKRCVLLAFLNRINAHSELEGWTWTSGHSQLATARLNFLASLGGEIRCFPKCLGCNVAICRVGWQCHGWKIYNTKPGSVSSLRSLLNIFFGIFCVFCRMHSQCLFECVSGVASAFGILTCQTSQSPAASMNKSRDWSCFLPPWGHAAGLQAYWRLHGVTNAIQAKTWNFL